MCATSINEDCILFPSDADCAPFVHSSKKKKKKNLPDLNENNILSPKIAKKTKENAPVITFPIALRHGPPAHFNSSSPPDTVAASVMFLWSSLIALFVF